MVCSHTVSLFMGIVYLHNDSLFTCGIMHSHNICLYDALLTCEIVCSPTDSPLTHGLFTCGYIEYTLFCDLFMFACADWWLVELPKLFNWCQNWMFEPELMHFCTFCLNAEMSLPLNIGFKYSGVVTSHLSLILTLLGILCSFHMGHQTRRNL